MPVNSIKKGKSFERDIAKFLTEITKVKWNRVPMSGAFSTVNKSNDPRFFGDVFTEDPLYNNIVIECKSHKEIVFNELFNLDSKLYKWLKQAEDEAKELYWILFFKLNNRGRYMVYDKEKLHINNESSFYDLVIGILKLFKSSNIDIRKNDKNYRIIKI